MLSDQRIEVGRKPGKPSLGSLPGSSRDRGPGRRLRPEQDAQEGHNGQEREEGQDGTEGVEGNVARQVQAVAEDEPEKVAEPPHAPVVPR